MTFRLGLTGGLASGKSTVARLLAERGCTVVDADHLVAELYRPGEAGSRRVEELFGDDYLEPDGGVDRPKLAQRVFSDDLARRRLESAVWPLVRERFAALAEEAPEDAVVVLEATLLVEAGFASAFDLVVTVEAPRQVRLERAVERGLEEGEAEARLAAQGDGDARRAGADLVLDNAGTLADLEQEVEGLLAEIRAGKFGDGAGPPADAADGDSGDAAAPRLPPFVFVTGNRHKLMEAERVLGQAVEAAPLDLPEIQSLDLVEVLRAKAVEAWRLFERPLVVEESGLEMSALGGFPGPLVKWMLKAAGAEGLARTAHALGDPRVVAHCALLYKHGPGDDEEVVVHGRVSGELVLPPRGDGGFGWDPVVVPDGAAGRTVAELADAGDKEAHSPRGEAWRELARRLGDASTP